MTVTRRERMIIVIWLLATGFLISSYLISLSNNQDYTSLWMCMGVGGGILLMMAIGLTGLNIASPEHPHYTSSRRPTYIESELPREPILSTDMSDVIGRN